MPSPITRVAFDESGNTGANLLDPEQPLYVLSAVCVDERDASALVAAHLGQARELRYAQLARRPSGRRKILEVLNAGLLTEDNARVTPVLKVFMVTAKLFDQLMEPALYARGYDIYERGLQVRVAEDLFRRGPRGCGREVWSDLLLTFVTASRERTDEAIALFMHSVRRARIAAGDDHLADLLSLIPDEGDTAWTMRVGGDSPIAGISLDPGPTCLIASCGFWSGRFGRIRVVFDENPSIVEWLPVFRTLASSQAAEFVGDYWAPRMNIPLEVDEFETVSSADAADVQLADLIAGACRTWVVGKHVTQSDDPFVEELDSSVLPHLIENELWPGRLPR